MSAFYLCCPVEGLRRADPPSKQSYQLSLRFIVPDQFCNGNTPEGVICQRERKICCSPIGKTN
jgi:hypothetical protein